MTPRSKIPPRKHLVLGSILAIIILLTVAVTVFKDEPSSDGGDVIFIGDSYIAGDGAPGGKGLAFLTAAELGLAPTISADSGSGYTRAGRGGFTTTELVAAAPDRSGAELIVLASGYNDNLGSPPNPDNLLINARSAVSAAADRWPRAQVVVLGPWTPRGSPSVNQTAVNSTLRSVAMMQAVTFVDTITPPLVKAPMIGVDKVHPTPAGHRAIAEDLASRLRAASR